MAELDWNPDTGGRSLAEILREAGIESAARAERRRRWDDPEETGIRQRRAEAASAARGSEYGRRRSDQSLDEPRVERRSAPERRAPVEPRDLRRPEPGPNTAAIPGVRPDRKPGVPATGATASGPVHVGEQRAAEPPPQRSAQRSEQRTPQRSALRRDHPQTGPIPVIGPDDIAADLEADLDAGPGESALAWLRFVGELVIALAAGVGVYFAATVLWEIVPHVAVLLAPLAVTGLVAGVGMWRQRQGREPIGPRLLAILVFAGTLLTIAPAAGLLAGS
ncbi:MAG TPA: hypothetical protein VK402_10085 [Blastococcus sp.]|nr:hypothetical protein [Blastococcus sp.]